MSTLAAFVGVVAAFALAGVAWHRWDAAHRIRFGDEAGSNRATIALARFEGRQIAEHPAWIITFLFVTGLVSFLVIAAPDQGATVGEPVIWFAASGLPVVGLALVMSVHRVATRSRRSGTGELEASTPTSPATRTSGLLLACLAPVPALVVGAVVAVVVSRIASPFTPSPTLAVAPTMLAVVLAGVGGGVVGVLLSRWLPIAVGPVLGIVALVWLNNGPGHRNPRLRWLRVLSDVGYGGHFDITPVKVVVPVFVAGLVALGAALASLTHPLRRSVLGATVVAALVVGASGWVLTRPPGADDVARVVAELSDPMEHQHCELHGGDRFCVHTGAERWIGSWAPAVAGVRQHVPASAQPDAVDIVQRPLVDPRELLPEVRAAIDGAVVWRDDGAVHPSLEIDGERPDLAVAWGVAAIAVGLPPAVTWERPSGCMAGGQARLVLAHVLAGAATATTRRGVSRMAGEVREESLHGSPRPLVLEGVYDVETPQAEGAEVRPGERRAADGTTWVDDLAAVGASGWGSDVIAAEELLRLGDDRLDPLLAKHWDELVDASTPTSRFLELAGLDAPSTGRAMTVDSDHHACP